VPCALILPWALLPEFYIKNNVFSHRYVIITKKNPNHVAICYSLPIQLMTQVFPSAMSMVEDFPDYVKLYMVLHYAGL